MPAPASPLTYARRRPEETTLYKVVQENLATLYGAVDDNALAIRLPGFVRKELEGYLECGLLCRGFARVQCGDWQEAPCGVRVWGSWILPVVPRAQDGRNDSELERMRSALRGPFGNGS